jgi:hypothetical protein
VHIPRRAQELATLIEEQNWRLVNIPDTPTYYYRNRKGSSILDMMLAMPHMAEEITNWAIDEEQATRSDHEVIRFQVVSLHPDVEVTPTNHASTGERWTGIRSPPSSRTPPPQHVPNGNSTDPIPHQ